MSSDHSHMQHYFTNMILARYRKYVTVLALLATTIALAIPCCPLSVSADTTQSQTFVSSPDDGHLRLNGHDGWDALKASQDSAEVYNNLRYVKINTRDTVIYRGYLFFDTSSLPDDQPITGAVLHIYSKCTGDLDDCQLYVLAGNEAYPHIPLQPEDFTLPDGLPVCAHVDVGRWTQELAYRTIQLDGPDTTIDTTGITRLCLLERRDQENATPPDPASENELKLYSFEEGEGFQPYLEVFWGGPMPAEALVTPEADTQEETPVDSGSAPATTTEPTVNEAEEPDPTESGSDMSTVLFIAAAAGAVAVVFLVYRQRRRNR